MMASFEIKAEAYGRSTMRGLVWVLPVVVLTPSLAFVFLKDRVADLARLSPLLSLPVIAVMVFMLAGMRKRHITIAGQGRLVKITGWRRGTYEGRVTDVEVLPWIMPGLGVAQGAAACLKFQDESVLCIGAWGHAVPATAARSTNNPDAFVDAKTLSSLLAALGVQESPIASNAQQAPFTVVKYQPVRGAFAGMVWWFGTIAFLGTFGALLGERLMQQPWGTAVVAGVSLAAVAFGLYKTFAQSRRDKPKHTLSIADGSVDLRDPRGATVWSGHPGGMTTTHETYVYRTKYGSHRFPVLVLTGARTTLRLGVWDTQARWQDAAASVGPAPHYLVAAPDWDRLLAACQSLQQERRPN